MKYEYEAILDVDDPAEADEIADRIMAVIKAYGGALSYGPERKERKAERHDA